MPHTRTIWLSVAVMLATGTALALAGCQAAPLAPVSQPSPRLASQPVSAVQSVDLERPSITVVSDGVASTRPDQAWLTAGVQITQPTAAEALAEAGRVTEAVLLRLDSLGIERAQVQTTGLSLFPVYDTSPRPSGGEPVLIGYRAVSSLTIQVRDLDKVGTVLDGMVAAGANQIGGVRFGLRDDSALRAQAMQAAAAGARPLAQALATGLGVTLGEVLQVRVVDGAVPQPAAMAEVARSAPAGVPFEAGELTIRVRVQVTFGLG